MDNQHRKIVGYRELNQEEINQMNKVKELGKLIGSLVEEMENKPIEFDKRWLAIGKTDLQKGLMALTRSIAQPTFF